MSDSKLTSEQWKEAFWRLAIIEDFESLTAPSVAGEDGTDWVPGCKKYDVEANALAILDDDLVRKWNESADERLLNVIFNKEWIS